MSFSYDPTRLDIPRNQLRLLLGTEGTQLETFQDEELDYIISQSTVGTDDTNKIKYYYTPSADSGCLIGTWDDNDWQSLENSLENGILKGKNLLKEERDSFGMAEYNKDGTDYFYIILNLDLTLYIYNL